MVCGRLNKNVVYIIFILRLYNATDITLLFPGEWHPKRAAARGGCFVGFRQNINISKILAWYPTKLNCACYIVPV